MTVDYTRLLEKISPKPGAEDVVRWRTGIVDAVNPDGTLDVAISALVIPSLPVLDGALAAVSDTVQIVSFRGALIVMGKLGRPRQPGTSIRQVTQSIASANVTPGGSAAAITGISIAVTTTRANQPFRADYVMDVELFTAGAATVLMYPALDGSPVLGAPQAIWNPANVANGARETVSNFVVQTIATPGAHTFTALCQKVGASGAYRVNSAHTSLGITLYD